MYILSMAHSNILNVAPKLSLVQIYGDAGLICIRYNESIVTKPNSQKNIGGSRPAFSSIVRQPNYSSSAGDYYSLLMGCEFKPGRWSTLLDFDK